MLASRVKAKVVENLTKRNGFGPLVWPEIEELHERHPSRLYANPTAWWNSEISKHFLDYHFGHRKGKNLDAILLLWDDFSAHFSEDVIERAKSLNVVLEKIPPTFTWMCQPADVAWMKPLKAAMRSQWVTYMRREIQGQDRTMSTFKLRPPSREQLVEWVNESWEALPRSTIIQGFVKCKIIDGVADVPELDDGQVDVNAGPLDEISTIMDSLRIGGLSVEELDCTSDVFDQSCCHDDHDNTNA
ncbi:hypothetical protein DYB32_010383 [Aphanomyces invadans]|uniref:DDE-1 domain-containing protein n=1 Tax=Aphanomyces invadans TaxID=157072 RepID=A0A3R6VDY4_9STRA|nr:hypothetical protein DYB32_010383 [Aphanomyces invadans]